MKDDDIEANVSEECTDVQNVDSEETPKKSLENEPEKPQPTSLSKRQIKKLRKKEKFESIKKEKKLKEKEKVKQKKREAIALGLSLGLGPTRKQLKKIESQNRPGVDSRRIAFDLNYDAEMSEADVSKCLKQLIRIYSINRRSSHQCSLYFTGINSEGRVHNSFKRNDGWENWKVSYHFDRTHDEVFPKDEIIYLTCESDEVLHTLEKDKVYVIGGLVDHNHHKGLCHERAVKANLRTARLPLSEYVDMKTRQVLSTYHVFEILLKVNEGKSWTEAILGTLPMRKGAKAKTSVDDNDVETRASKVMKIDTNVETTHEKGISKDNQDIRLIGLNVNDSCQDS